MDNIAIIGLGCRFPQADNPEEFWHLVSNGMDAITEIPADRWDVDEFYAPQSGIPGKMNTRSGGFLSQIDGFDPLFFNISPTEAQRMDPKQRIFLEVAWEAIENAGLAPDKLSGTQTGVFVAPTGGSQYHQLLYKNVADLTQINAYDGIGSTPSLAASRLSYLLNLKGPSLAIETACSSSLVATHLACQSLRTGESNLCIVGGVNLILTPELHISFSQANMMSPEGRCKTFDADANGYVRGEGCGVVILKRLSDAIEDRDNIMAMIRGSAINQDGLSNGITAPNSPSQQAVIRQALKNAGVKPAEISYVEAHGTGTPLGDPIEIQSLKTVLMKDRLPSQTCYISSVKANIGHLELASGIAGLIKVVLSLQNQQVPKNLHFKRLNPLIDIEHTPFVIPTELEEWHIEQGSRLAGVSSFGFGGTNAHVILEEAPKLKAVEKNSSSDRPKHLLTLSAKSEKALQELAQRYEAYLESHPKESLEDICYTANTRRSHFDYRLAVIADSTMQLREQLDVFASGKDTAELVNGQVTSCQKPKIAFLFTGQGSHYTNMGRQLYQTQPVFRQALEQCAQLLSRDLEQSLWDILYGEQTGYSLLDRTSCSQPAIFALEYALAQLWQSWGIKPDVVMGHSLGEYVAACVAGIFTLEEGLKLVTHRGRLMQALPANGKMVSVLADEATVKKAIDSYEGAIAIAAFNGSRSLVISGKQDKVDIVRAKLERSGIKTKELNVSHAFHSQLMEPILAEYASIAAQVNYKIPKIPLISNVTGKRADENIANAEYWVRHIRQPVRFAQSMETLNQGDFVFVEIGAKPILIGMGRQCLEADARAWLPSLRPGVEDWQQILSSLAQLYVRGIRIDWLGFDLKYARRKVSLPTYPFQRQRYWIETTKDRQLQNESNLIYNLLYRKEIELVGNELKKSGKLLEDEIELLPKVLELLVNQCQQQSEIVPFTQNGTSKVSQMNEKLSDVDSLAQESNSDEILTAEPAKRKHLLKSYISRLLAKVVGIPPSALDWQKRLSELGIDSLMATEIRHLIESNLKIAAPIEYYAELNLEEFLTQIFLLIEKNSSDLAIVPAAPTQQWFKFSPRNSKPRFRLFCFHHAGTGASIFNSWSEKLPSDTEVISIQLPGRENRLKETPFTRLKPLIQTLTPLFEEYLDVPFAFFGHSMGALLSFEVARELRRKSWSVPECLFVSAYRAPQIPDLDLPIYQLPDAKFIKAVSDYQGISEQNLQNLESRQILISNLKADFEILQTYFYTKEEPLESHIYAFGGLADPKVSRQQLAAWEQQTKIDFQLKMFNGNHFFWREAEDEVISTIKEAIERLTVMSLSQAS